MIDDGGKKIIDDEISLDVIVTYRATIPARLSVKLDNRLRLSHR